MHVFTIISPGVDYKMVYIFDVGVDSNQLWVWFSVQHGFVPMNARCDFFQWYKNIVPECGHEANRTFKTVLSNGYRTSARSYDCRYEAQAG